MAASDLALLFRLCHLDEEGVTCSYCERPAANLMHTGVDDDHPVCNRCAGEFAAVLGDALLRLAAPPNPSAPRD